jgi:hypothetical protein
MPCSAGEPSYDQACGWRVLRQADGGAEIWIANIAVSDRDEIANYRLEMIID